MATVTIPCPRCSGRGVGHWKPDGGICYRCGGKKLVVVDTEKYVRVLHMLRAKYLRLLAEIRAVEAAGEDPSLGREALAYVVQDGLRVRSTLESLGVDIR
jgi:hypothetical protein